MMRKFQTKVGHYTPRLSLILDPLFHSTMGNNPTFSDLKWPRYFLGVAP